jgi:hypothetical protein
VSETVTTEQIQAAVAIFTAFEMSQDTPDQTDVLAHTVAEMLPALTANGLAAAVGAFCALMRPLLQYAAGSTDPEHRARTWQHVIHHVAHSGIKP